MEEGMTKQLMIYVKRRKTKGMVGKKMKMEEKMENHREDKGKKYAQMKEKDAQQSMKSIKR